MLDNLPLEILPRIFNDLDWKALSTIPCVSKKYQAIEKTYENDLWEKFLNNRCQKNKTQPNKMSFFKAPLMRQSSLVFIDSYGKQFQKSLEKTLALIKETPLAETDPFIFLKFYSIHFLLFLHQHLNLN